MAKIQNLYGSFVLIGDAVFKDTFYAEKTSASQYAYRSLRLGVKTAQGNTVFAESMGGYSLIRPNLIRTMDKDKNKLEIDFKDRLDSEIVKTVAEFRKLNVELSGNKQVFLSEYDFIEAIKNQVVNGARIVVTGNIVMEKYKTNDGSVKIRMKYVMNNVRLAKETDINKAEATINFVVGADSLDKARLKKEGKIDVSGYFMTYVKELKENEFIGLPNLVLDVEHLKKITAQNTGTEIDDATMETILKMYEGYLKASKRDTYIETSWKMDIVNGNEVKEITMDDLSKEQRVLIDLKMAKFEDIVKSMGGNSYGETVSELRLVRPTFKYKDKKEVPVAFIDTEYKEEDFYAKTPQVASADTLIGAVGTTKDTALMSDIDKLFGK